MFVGVAYWAGWRILLPRVFGYELVPRKEKLEDGTVVTLVGASHERNGLVLWISLVFTQENSVNTCKKCHSECLVRWWFLFGFVVASMPLPEICAQFDPT